MGRQLYDEIAAQFIVDVGCTPEDFNSIYYPSAVVNYFNANKKKVLEADYGLDFTLLEVACLMEAEVPKEKIPEYLGCANGTQIACLYKNDMDLFTCYAYNHEPLDAVILRDKGITPKQVRQYNMRMNTIVTELLIEEGVEGDYFNQLHGRFNYIDIIYMSNAKVPVEKAVGFPEKYQGAIVAAFHTVGITPDHIVEKPLLDRLADVMGGLLYHSELNRYEFFATGTCGVLLRDENKALKITAEAREERSQLEMFAEAGIVPKNVMRLMHESVDNEQDIYSGDVNDHFMILEHVPGRTIEEILVDEEKMPAGQVLKYGSQILNGLSEMRQAGLWHHRDIRPANVMINDEDEAVIIDLGNATTDREFSPKFNRRYGGPNDLVSLGQLMYKMATGKHLFTRSRSMDTTICATDLKEHRVFVYGNAERVRYYTRKVERVISDEKLAEIIKWCINFDQVNYDFLAGEFHRD